MKTILLFRQTDGLSLRVLKMNIPEDEGYLIYLNVSA